MDIRQRLEDWADSRLISGWRTATRLWSVRVNLLVGIATILVVILGLVSDEVKTLIGWKTFSVVFFSLSLIGLMARLMGQKPEDDS